MPCHPLDILETPTDSRHESSSEDKRRGYSIKEGGKTQDVSVAIIDRKRGRPPKSKDSGEPHIESGEM